MCFFNGNFQNHHPSAFTYLCFCFLLGKLDSSVIDAESLEGTLKGKYQTRHLDE